MVQIVIFLESRNVNAGIDSVTTIVVISHHYHRWPLIVCLSLSQSGFRNLNGFTANLCAPRLLPESFFVCATGIALGCVAATEIDALKYDVILARPRRRLKIGLMLSLETTVVMRTRECITSTSLSRPSFYRPVCQIRMLRRLWRSSIDLTITCWLLSTRAGCRFGFFDAASKYGRQ